MKTSMVLLASVASTADAISCMEYGVLSVNRDCTAAVYGNPDNCYARDDSGSIWQTCDTLGSNCVDSTTGVSEGACANSAYENDENACITAGCTFIDLIPNYYAVIMPSGSTCCEDTDGALVAISPTDFDGVQVDGDWFTANCSNPVPCLARADDDGKLRGIRA